MEYSIKLKNDLEIKFSMKYIINEIYINPSVEIILLNALSMKDYHDFIDKLPLMIGKDILSKKLAQHTRDNTEFSKYLQHTGVMIDITFHTENSDDPFLIKNGRFETIYLKNELEGENDDIIQNIIENCNNTIRTTKPPYEYFLEKMHYKFEPMEGQKQILENGFIAIKAFCGKNKTGQYNEFTNNQAEELLKDVTYGESFKAFLLMLIKILTLGIAYIVAPEAMTSTRECKYSFQRSIGKVINREHIPSKERFKVPLEDEYSLEDRW